MQREKHTEKSRKREYAENGADGARCSAFLFFFMPQEDGLPEADGRGAPNAAARCRFRKASAGCSPEIIRKILKGGVTRHIMSALA